MLGFKVNPFLVIGLISIRLYCAFNGIISDCDEVYNYWEPLNFLTRYFGKQTWEYSPVYAIRSWAYLLPFSIFNYPLKFIQSKLEEVIIPSYVQFYLIRTSIALGFAFAELNLAESLRFLDVSLSNWFLILQTFNAGMSHAAISLLPGSFSLLFGMFATASMINYLKYDKFMMKIFDSMVESLKQNMKISNDPVDDNYRLKERMHNESQIVRNKSFAIAVLCSTVAGLLGWPFSLVLCVPFMIYVTITNIHRRKYSTLATYLLVGLSSVFLTGMAIFQIDKYFYKKITFVPLNIILYNVLYTSEDSGPNIFGTEPLSYYIFNLLLNFNITFIFAVIGLLAPISFQKLDLWHVKVLLTPMLLWCGIFWTQPHKEERFMYPVYHLISISGALTIYKISNMMGYSNIFNKSYTFIAKTLIFSTVVLISTLRIVSLVKNYSAPLTVFKHLPHTSSSVIENVCVGREWYHYPSSFFLSDNQRLKFVENGFRGMLPGDFIEPDLKQLSSLPDSISTIPEHFNNNNEYVSSLVDKFSVCDYYFDIDIPVDPKMGEVSMFTTENSGVTNVNIDGWDLIYCDEFIDTDTSYGLNKLIYLPFSEINDLYQYLDTEFNVSDKLQLITDKLSMTYNLMLSQDIVQHIVKNERIAAYTGKQNDQFNKIHDQFNKAYHQLVSKVPNCEKAVDFLMNGEVKYHKMCLASRSK